MNNTKKGRSVKSSNEQTDKILKILSKRGLVADENIDNEKIRVAQQKKRQESFHNTELLLKKYRDIVWMMECFPENIAKELDEPLSNFDAMLERLDLEMTLGNKKVENRLASIEKTRLMIDRVNDALTVLKKKPSDGDKLYKVIKITYIEPEVLNHHEILYRLNLSARQYYRYREQAITVLSLRLWSAPNSDIDLWMELLNALS